MILELVCAVVFVVVALFAVFVVVVVVVQSQRFVAERCLRSFAAVCPVHAAVFALASVLASVSVVVSARVVFVAVVVDVGFAKVRESEKPMQIEAVVVVAVVVRLAVALSVLSAQVAVLSVSGLRTTRGRTSQCRQHSD